MDIYENLRKIDFIKLNFDENSSVYLNITIAFIMLGVALELNLDDFKKLLTNPKPALVGILSQFILLPFFTFLVVLGLQEYITPAVGLGMILVASCPGGNISNFISNLAKGNLALSV
ncbi:MAG: bile acid:sodium symporter, partial [Cyclobacteriaceae bacterium]|nr:bile acid:sodium symporter [Cyclobacteriaceae bacterium]